MSLRQVIGGHRAFVTKLATKIHEALQLSEPDEIQLKSWLPVLHYKEKEVSSLYEKLINTLEEDSDICVAVEDHGNFIERVQRLIVEIEQKLARNSTKEKEYVRVNLPKIQLPEFEGGSSEWDAFWDLFQANVGVRTDLSPAMKLSYLK